MKADLHCHSHFSDGKHSPEYLLARARDRGLTHLAITDHDCVDAHRDLVEDHGISVIKGVEISTQWRNREIHVVGLGIDIEDDALQQLLQQQQESRRERLEEISRLLERLEITGLAAHITELPCSAPTRSHAADFLVQRGHSKTMQKAFKKYLGSKGRAYVPANWCSLASAIATLTAAGGISVLAHPGRYGLGKRQLKELFSEFRSSGGEAAEVSYGNIDPASQKRLIELADEQGLFLSQGSDFHDRAATWTDLGKFPSLNVSGEKNAIWHHPRWHS